MALSLRPMMPAAVLGLLVLALAADRPPPRPAQLVATPMPQEIPAGSKYQERLPRAEWAAALHSPGQDLAHLPAFSLLPPFGSIDGTTLLRDGRRIVLHGIEGPGASDTCLDGEGQRWSCGLQARAALHNMLAGQSLICRPVQSLESGGLSARCRLREGMAGEPDRDLAAVLVLAGWARPLQDQPGLREEREAARARGFGLWRGGWTLYPSRP